MMSDNLTISIITGLLALFSTIFTGVMAYFIRGLELKSMLTQRTVEAVHTLVNANMGAQLKISAIALRRLSIISGSNDDRAAADLADKLYDEHNVKQAVVDSHT